MRRQLQFVIVQIAGQRVEQRSGEIADEVLACRQRGPSNFVTAQDLGVDRRIQRLVHPPNRGAVAVGDDDVGRRGRSSRVLLDTERKHIPLGLRKRQCVVVGAACERRCQRREIRWKTTDGIVLGLVRERELHALPWRHRHGLLELTARGRLRRIGRSGRLDQCDGDGRRQGDPQLNRGSSCAMDHIVMYRLAELRRQRQRGRG